MDLIDPRDQATVVMLSSACFLGVIAVVFFLCQWYKKSAREQENTKKAPKPTNPVQRTFSRFSQVDEELTVHAFRESVYIPELKSEPGAALDKIIHPAPVTEMTIKSPNGKPYLETHM